MQEAKQLLIEAQNLIINNKANKIAEMVFNFPHPKDLAKATNKEEQTILFKLTAMQDQKSAIKAIEFMVKLGIDPKKKDHLSQTAFYYAARHEHLEIVKFLFGYGVDFNEFDLYGQTPLFYCARYNISTQVSQFLISNGCNVNHKDSFNQTCIFYAAKYNKLELCKLFVKYGANINVSDKNKEKPIHYAKKQGHQSIIQFLSHAKPGGGVKQQARSYFPKQVKIQRAPAIVHFTQSSQSVVNQKKKKQSVRNEYALVYTNENGFSRVLTQDELQQFKSASDDHNKIYKMIFQPEEPVQWTTSINDKKFQRIALKILSHFQKDINGYHFNEPVNYELLNLLDYPTIVKYPMDFGTIKKKLTMNVYENQLQFQGDMNLVFDDCILYNGTAKDIGKIALQMRTQFNAMFIKEFS